MKVLRWLVYLLIGVLLLGVVLALVGPKTFRVSRSTVIDANRNEVFRYVDRFSNIEKWNPWAELDPDMTTSVTGEEGKVGAVYSWEGNDQVGTGTQTIVEIVPAEKVKTQLHFMKPMESEADASTFLEDTVGGTKVSWVMEGKNNFISRIFMNFMSMDAMMGPDFEKGMQKLKTLVESNKQSMYNGYEVKVMDGSRQLYAGVRKDVPIEDITPFFADNFGRIMQKAGDQAAGMPCSLTYVWDEENQVADIAAAVPVTGSVDGLTMFDIPAGKMLMIDYFGAYEAIGAAHVAMDQYMQAHQMEMIPPAIEAYITDPGMEPDTSKWLTRLTYPVKEKR